MGAAELGATYPVFQPRVQFDHILSDGVPRTQRRCTLPVSGSLRSDRRLLTVIHHYPLR